MLFLIEQIIIGNSNTIKLFFYEQLVGKNLIIVFHTEIPIYIILVKKIIEILPKIK